jgi:hypothetical protein
MNYVVYLYEGSFVKAFVCKDKNTFLKIMEKFEDLGVKYTGKASTIMELSLA